MQALMSSMNCGLGDIVNTIKSGGINDLSNLQSKAKQELVAIHQ